MDVQAISTLFTTVGIPTALCIYLIDSNRKTNDKNMEVIEKLRQTIENNTKAMIKLTTKMGVDTDE